MSAIDDLREGVQHMRALLAVTGCEASCAETMTGPPCEWCKAADWYDDMVAALDGPDTAPPGGGIRHNIGTRAAS